MILRFWMALQRAKPVKDRKVAFVARIIEAGQFAMMKQLPAQRLAIVVLGGSHDLRDALPGNALYHKMRSKAYPGE